ncbi:MAG: putative Major facilitator superfamily transporter [Promethearchaeota archaeon]|nr:MAG: putative Major facilitator superfamily transporter [Candidatus Lokiarchaeota archaeon]
MLLMTIAYILWGVWNAINDPLVGALSERTKHRGKWGKRKFFLIISIVPLSLMMVLMFYVPFDTDAKLIEFFYFLITITLFELFYTLFDCNVNALFPEMFTTEKSRASTNMFIKGVTLVALILSSIIPAIFIPDLVAETPAEATIIKTDYFTASLVIALITFFVTIPFLLKGVSEKMETEEDFRKRPGFFKSLKITLTNKTFVKFVLANTMIWYVFSILPLMLPIYAEHILNLDRGGALTSLALMSAFLVAGISIPIHNRMGSKFGMRNALIITMVIWISVLFPYFLISGSEFQIIFILITASQGFPLAGALFYVDILHGDIIDEDALNHGVKRSASYYGINAFIHRISIILVILTVYWVFGNIGWAKEYDPVVDAEFGLKMIMFVFPAIALMIGILFMKIYTLHGTKLEEMRKEMLEHPEIFSS